MKYHAKSPAVEGGPVTLLDDRNVEVKGTVRQLNPSGEMIVELEGEEGQAGKTLWAHNKPRPPGSKAAATAAAKDKGKTGGAKPGPSNPPAGTAAAPDGAKDDENAGAQGGDAEGEDDDDGKGHFGG